MENFKKFLNEISRYKVINEININDVRNILRSINDYFYTNYENIGNTFILDNYYEYFSDFHKFWEKYHKEILNPTVNVKKCEQVSRILNELYLKFGEKLFLEIYDIKNIEKEDICKIRYFSASQDFRGSRDITKLIKIYKNDPSIFDKNIIYKNPEDFLKNIGITSLSQNDKRVRFAKISAELLIKEGIEPFDLLKKYNNDISVLRNVLVNNKGSGFGFKKADIFLRDMIVLGVWQNYKNFDIVDVASDINTIKVALRSGILKTEVPLLSSFLDIFCYQYNLIDNYNALAWRKVWEIWKINFPNSCIESPSLIDYLIYRIIGKEFCNENLYIYKCDAEDHIFKWHSSRNKTCQICYKLNGVRNHARIIKKILPCMDEEGYLAIQNNEFVSGENALLPGIKECPFVNICNPKDKDFIKFNPPKSISILGKTGWESSKVRKGEGGGGLMS